VNLERFSSRFLVRERNTVNLALVAREKSECYHPSRFSGSVFFDVLVDLAKPLFTWSKTTEIGVSSPFSNWSFLNNSSSCSPAFTLLSELSDSKNNKPKTK